VNSQLDDVNELLKLKQGDLVRLAHIKKTLESRNVLYISDSKYLRELTKAYLEDHTGERFANYKSHDYPEYDNKLKETPPSEPVSKTVKEPETKKVESNKNSFCGNCGNSINDENFCPKCGHSLNSSKEIKPETKIQSKPKEYSPQEQVVYQKNKGMGIGKKILIGIGILTCIVIIAAFIISYSFISFVSDVADGTVEKSKDFQILEINETQTHGNMDVVIDKIEFYDEYAKIFLSVENFGNEESNIYQHNSYVKQGINDFQNMFQPFGATGERFDGRAIPSGVIREGIIFFEPWNPDEEFEITLDGLYVPPNQEFGYKLPETITFVFNISPIISDSKCGAGTVFDEVTNSCVLEGTQTTSNSKCGAGTVFDEVTNTCIVE